MEFKKNIGAADRAVRAVVGLVLAWLFATNSISAPLSYIALIVAIAMLATSAMGSCYLYTLLKINTAGKK